ncbi:MAG: DUF4270 domain-containing protein [Chitinophagales bacterium]|nr:DUF4270 domain-containing protein [Chitinophagales bacterium]
MLKKFRLVNVLWLLPLLFLTYCDKDPSIGNEVGGTYINITDSTQLIAYSTLCESVGTKGATYTPLGILSDANFGKREASFYSQLRLTTNAYEPTGSNAVIDSGVLHLKIIGTYGLVNAPIDIEVYRLTEDLVSENTYYQSASLSYNATPIGTRTGYLLQSDSNIVSIPLTSQIAAELFNQFGTSTTTNNDNFLDYFKGIYVKVNSSSSGDGLLMLNLTSTETALKLYFHSSSANDTVYNFLADAQSIRVNKYSYDLAGSALETVLNDAGNNDQELYVGGLKTSKAFIDVPDLSFLQGSIINQAKLTFYQTDYGAAVNTGYNLPSYLFLYGYKDNDTLPYSLTDFSSTNETQYGGVKAEVDVNGVTTNAYTYYLPRFFQRVVNQETEITKMCIEVVNSYDGSRVVLGGGNHPQFPITLEITYTN